MVGAGSGGRLRDDERRWWERPPDVPAVSKSAEDRGSISSLRRDQMTPLKAVIVGSGLIANLKHIPAFKKHHRKVQLSAVCDVNLEAAKKVAAAHDIPHAYDSVADMIAKEKPDIVDICTPPKTHASIAIDAMHRGCHVLI